MDDAIKWIYANNTAANCFFRSTLNPPELKVMLQITTRCNMRCKHCFLSATGLGADLPFSSFNNIINALIESNVRKVTLTGGEPLLHPNVVEMIKTLDSVHIQSCICTNASLVTEEMLNQFRKYDVHFNVSLDGVYQESYGHFREISKQNQLAKVLNNIKMIGQYKMLNGILTTPNRLTKMEEYTNICDVAVTSGAKYLLLNPLSPFGRGKDASALTLLPEEMNQIRKQLDAHLSCISGHDAFQIVYIRFPNCTGKDPSACSAGLIPYIFTNGDIAICPYMVFAAENADNDYNRSDYIIGNVYKNGKISEMIQSYRCTHSFCQSGSKENIGCAAMKIAKNLSLDSNDIL